MRKVILAAAFVVASIVGANAQSKSGFHLSVGARVGLPIGTFGDAYSFALGAELQGEYMFAENVSGVVSAGYTHFLGKTVGSYKVPGTGVIPILAGVRVYPSTNMFIAGKVGVSLSTESGGGSAFTYEPQVGYNGGKFSLAVLYNGQSNGGTIGYIGLVGLIKLN